MSIASSGNPCFQAKPAGRFVLVAVLVLAALPVRAEAPAAYDAATCDACHAALAKKKEVHPALAAGTCADCHVPSDNPGKCKSPLAKGWRLKADEPALCRDCHPRTGNTPLHPVIDSMGCTPCHDPHSSDNASLLKVSPVADLCKTCHDGVDNFPSTHTPVKKGQCLSCHDPHTSAEPHLLKSKESTLCLKCHKLQDLLPNRTKHAPVAEGECTQCHSPHGSKFSKNTLAEAGDLCMKCHDAKAVGGMKSPQGRTRIDLKKQTVHPALDAGGCVACHVSTHSSVMPKLLKKRPVELCYDCHERQDGKAFVHGAVRLGDCAVCHEPHASDYAPLLRKEKPAETCFLCHSDDATGRDFVHKPVADGRCTACHSPHGAADPFSISRGSGKNLCYACHKTVDAGKNKHPVLERGGCVACHDPHAGNNPFFLAKPVNALCISCHPNQKDGTHVTSFIPNGHKISGGPDPHNIDRDFSCASCHNPHGSDGPKLLRFGDNTMEACDGCHGDRMGKHPEWKDVSKRKRADKNVVEYRAEVPSSLLKARTGSEGKQSPPPVSALDAGAAGGRDAPLASPPAPDASASEAGAASATP
jgi:predicted CXXCH cytochrome family protein